MIGTDLEDAPAKSTQGKKKKKKVKKSKKAVTNDVPEISTRDEESALNEQNERLSQSLMDMQNEETKI